MEVQIISKETVKPSLATTSHPKIFKLSVLDQLIPARYAPLVLFYPMNKDSASSDVCTRLSLLKTSLSEMMSCFYPLAGKIQDDLSIDCNDEGACFVETRVNSTLEEFLKNPDLLLINKFLPCEFVSSEPLVGTFVTNVQVNVFKCDGIAVGICMSHRVMDGDGLRMFLKAWTSQKPKETDFAGFGSRFPADDLWLRDSSMAMWGSFMKKGSCRTKRFVFYSSAIAKLKSEAIESGLNHPTRVEVVSAILWKSMVAASVEVNGIQRPSMLSHLVNLRRRFPGNEESMAENSLGNFLWIATAKHDQTKPTFVDLAGKVREGIARIDLEFVEKLKGKNGKSVMLKSLEEATNFELEKADYFGFSSWCNFRYYDVADFGWGKPVWVSSIGLANPVFFSLIILADTKCGEGIEAWVTLDEQEMSILEKNPDIIKLASLDPSLLAN